MKQKKSESKLLDTISLLSTSPSEKCEEKKVTTVKDAYFENFENFDDTDEGWYSRDASEGRVLRMDYTKFLILFQFNAFGLYVISITKKYYEILLMS